MILLDILFHDLTGRRKEDAIPLCVDFPGRKEFLPAVVSNTKGKFVPINHLGPGSLRGLKPDAPWDPNAIYGAVFPWDSDRLDDVLRGMFQTAYELSVSEKWGNVFSGRAPARRAFDYVRDSTLPGQPHVCLVPEDWSPSKVKRFFGQTNLDKQQRRYRKYCRVTPCKIDFPVFLSRPDFVGKYEQFMGGHTSIVLHNVRRGMGFCP